MIAVYMNNNKDNNQNDTSDYDLDNEIVNLDDLLKGETFEYDTYVTLQESEEVLVGSYESGIVSTEEDIVEREEAEDSEEEVVETLTESDIDSTEEIEGIEETEETEEIVEVEDTDKTEYLLDLDSEVPVDTSKIVMEDIIYDAKGSPINTLVDGDMFVDNILLEDILVPPRGKLFKDDLSELEESIHMWGLVEPIHVVPYGDKYILLSGYRRLMAYQNMGNEVIPAIVDSSRPKEVIRYLEVITNNIRPYNFIERMRIGEFIEERQEFFSHETIENILGLPSGEYLKSKYIESAKVQFDEIYNKVVQNKMGIEQAFKRIEKELNKEDEELTPLDHLNQFGLGDDYGEIVEEEYVQQSGERHPLDPALRKYVEGRDGHSCQSCGMGIGEPDLASIFNVHHIIPVKHDGPDKKGNLILLCLNCHGYVHAFDEGRFKPSPDMVELYDTIHNIVVLGNIVKKGIPSNYELEAFDFYMERAKLTWLEEE